MKRRVFSLGILLAVLCMLINHYPKINRRKSGGIQTRYKTVEIKT